MRITSYVVALEVTVDAETDDEAISKVFRGVATALKSPPTKFIGLRRGDVRLASKEEEDAKR